MKWAITRDQLEQRLKQSGKTPNLKARDKGSNILVSEDRDSNIDACFKVYDNNDSLKKAKESEFREWASYDLPKVYDAEAQLRYEIFCGGWLQFFDVHMMHNRTDHAITFDWDGGNKVKVMITPKESDKAWSIHMRIEPPGYTDPPKPPPPPPPYS